MQQEKRKRKKFSNLLCSKFKYYWCTKFSYSMIPKESSFFFIIHYFLSLKATNYKYIFPFYSKSLQRYLVIQKGRYCFPSKQKKLI